MKVILTGSTGMKTILSCIFIFCIFNVDISVYAQGCSDAGACAIKSFKPQSQLDIEEDPNNLNIGVVTGAADHSIFTFGYYFGYSRHIGKVLSIDTRINFLVQNGNNIYTSGPGDFMVNINYHASQKLTFTAGLKVPLTKGDAIYALKPLPMDYQSSLGTLDLITGIGYQHGSWQFVLAYQQPLSQNENEFVPSAWEVDSPLRDFQATRGYQRKGDILLRVSHPIRLNEKLNFIPGLLPIYHMDDDEYLDSTNTYQIIEGSAGLTINAALFFDYKLNKSSKLGINLGFPILVREARPDGLTRSFVLGAEYALFF